LHSSTATKSFTVVAMASPTPTTPLPTTSKSTASSPSTSLIVATRLHLGQSTSPPADLDQKVAGFYQFCAESCSSPEGSTMGVLQSMLLPKLLATIWWKPYKRPVTRPWRLRCFRRRRRPTAATRLHAYTSDTGASSCRLSTLSAVAATHVSPPLYEGTPGIG
jgi:hypothetical protein